MKRDLAALAEVFAHAYGAGLDADRVAAALAVVFDEDLRASSTPFVSELRTRRIENIAGPIFRALERELQVTREDLVSASNARHLSPKRDALLWQLRGASLSMRAIAALVNRDRASVRAGVRRHQERLGARRRTAAMESR